MQSYSGGVRNKTVGLEIIRRGALSMMISGINVRYPGISFLADGGELTISRAWNHTLLS